MPAVLITKALLAAPPAIPDGQAKVRVFDSRLKGLIAEIRRNCITFYYRYQDARRRGREVKLGRFGDVTLEQVRKRAEQLKAETSLGHDPVAEAAKVRAIPTLEAIIRERYLPDVRDRLRSHANVDAYCRRIISNLGRKPTESAAQSHEGRRRLVHAGRDHAVRSLSAGRSSDLSGLLGPQAAVSRARQDRGQPNRRPCG
jgi:hypothetical protein